jgi:thioredoxin 1
MSNIRAVTDADWATEVLEAETPVLIDFWAEWCGPCRMVSPIVEEIAQEYGGTLKVVKLNVDENPDVTRQYRVMSIPTLLVIVDGVEKRRLVGARGKGHMLNDLEEFLVGQP